MLIADQPQYVQNPNNPEDSGRNHLLTTKQEALYKVAKVTNDVFCFAEKNCFLAIVNEMGDLDDYFLLDGHDHERAIFWEEFVVLVSYY